VTFKKISSCRLSFSVPSSGHSASPPTWLAQEICAAIAESNQRKEFSMCDYSLQGLPNRLAAVGEQLVTYRFRTGSIGMASPLDIAPSNRPQNKKHEGWWAALKCWLNPQNDLDQVPAVCVPPGARLRMTQVPQELQKAYGLNPVEVVTFTQSSADAFRYRDAIRFDTGSLRILQTLAEGLPFQVLSLDVEELAPEAGILASAEKVA
jgi:hypothetical protein